MIKIILFYTSYNLGKETSIAVHFTPANVVKTLAVKVKAHLGVIWVPYTIDKPDACKDSGLTCPLTAGTEQNYEYALTVSTAYPSVSEFFLVFLKYVQKTF